MIQLSYQAAFDPFHAMYRELRILEVLDRSKSLPVDHMRILDFYLLFPFKISSIRMTPQHRKFRSVADEYEQRRPYGEEPDSAQVFRRMEPMQIAAIETLAEKKFVDPNELKNGRVLRSKTALPVELANRIRNANAQESQLVEVISTLASEYPFLGPQGLKSRTGLLDHRYDSI
jgi:hypothetical protein